MTPDQTKAAIVIATPVLVWLLAKIPRMPDKALPVLAPVVGVGLGLIANALGWAVLTPIDATQAGALGVFVREIVNQWVTKPINNQKEQAAQDGLDSAAREQEKPPSP